jgi:hypothetical protein
MGHRHIPGAACWDRHRGVPQAAPPGDVARRRGALGVHGLSDRVREPSHQHHERPHEEQAEPDHAGAADEARELLPPRRRLPSHLARLPVREGSAKLGDAPSEKQHPGELLDCAGAAKQEQRRQARAAKPEQEGPLDGPATPSARIRSSIQRSPCLVPGGRVLVAGPANGWRGWGRCSPAPPRPPRSIALARPERRVDIA